MTGLYSFRCGWWAEYSLGNCWGSWAIWYDLLMWF